jgi:hypothetical protein
MSTIDYQSRKWGGSGPILGILPSNGCSWLSFKLVGWCLSWKLKSYRLTCKLKPVHNTDISTKNLKHREAATRTCHDSNNGGLFSLGADSLRGPALQGAELMSCRVTAASVRPEVMPWRRWQLSWKKMRVLEGRGRWTLMQIVLGVANCRPELEKRV